MKSIHSKAFLDVWRALYHESNPGPTVGRWQVDGVDWVRETYRVGARDYAFHVDTHVLTHRGRGGASWTLLVVVERWWRPGRHDALKTSEWRQVIEGANRNVLAWFDRQRVRLEAQAPEGGSAGGRNAALPD